MTSIFITSKDKELGVRNVVDLRLGSNLGVVVVERQWDYILRNIVRVNLGPSEIIFYQASVTSLLLFSATILVECRLGESEEFGTIT